MSNDNAALVRRWFHEVWNEGRDEAIDDMLAEDGVVYGLGEVMRGPAEFRPFYRAYREAFPDIRVTVEEVLADGDLAAARWTASATHRGDGLGFPATGKKINLTGMTFVRVRRGKLVEGWNNFDQLGMLQQLGRLPLSALSGG